MSDSIPAAAGPPSSSKLKTEKEGLQVLLADARMQEVALETKRRILSLLNVGGAFKPQTFDAVMTPAAVEPLTATTIERHIETLALVEMKTTKADIANPALNRFFFGVTETEIQVAKALGERYLFAFVVLSATPERTPFFVLLTYEQMLARVRTQRIQFQINFRSDMHEDAEQFPHSGIGPQNST